MKNFVIKNANSIGMFFLVTLLLATIYLYSILFISTWDEIVGFLGKINDFKIFIWISACHLFFFAGVGFFKLNDTKKYFPLIFGLVLSIVHSISQFILIKRIDECYYLIGILILVSLLIFKLGLFFYSRKLKKEKFTCFFIESLKRLMKIVDLKESPFVKKDDMDVLNFLVNKKYVTISSDFKIIPTIYSRAFFVEISRHNFDINLFRGWILNLDYPIKERFDRKKLKRIRVYFEEISSKKLEDFN